MIDLVKLVQDAQAGDRSAFRELVEQTRSDLFHLALGILRNRDDAEDVLQEVYIKVYRNLQGFRGESAVRSWLYRIAVNTSLDWKRGGKLVKLALDDSGGVDEPAAVNPHSDPRRGLDAREIREQIGGALTSLSPLERAVFTLRHESGLRLREIAATLERSEGTVKNILFRAIRKLRDQLKHLHDQPEVRTS